HRNNRPRPGATIPDRFARRIGPGQFPHPVLSGFQKSLVHGFFGRTDFSLSRIYTSLILDRLKSVLPIQRSRSDPSRSLGARIIGISGEPNRTGTGSLKTRSPSPFGSVRAFDHP